VHCQRRFPVTAVSVTIRIFLVDDHVLVRRAVRLVLNGEADFDVVGEAGSADEAIRAIQDAVPDIAIVDVQLPDASGVELCRTLKSTYPALVCLMLTSVDDRDARVASVAAGASGFVLKTIRGRELTESIRVAVGDR